MPSKTPLRQPIVRRLEALNDQLQLFLLTEFELLDRLASFAPAVENAFTADVFARNPYAPRIHVRLKEVQRYQAANRQFTFGAYFSTTFEVASNFFPQAIDLLKRTNGVTISSSRKVNEGPEEHFYRVLAAAHCPLPSDAIRDTFTYCRHRRNGFIHLASTPSSSFVAFTSAHGNALNTHWGTTRDALDFGIPAAGQFSESDTIALIKLLRISVLKLDDHLASIVQEAGAVAYCAQREFGDQPVRINADVARQRARKLKGVVKRDFGFEPSETMLEQVSYTVGAR